MTKIDPIVSWSRRGALAWTVGVVGVWLSKGAHPGWTRDSVFREIPDPVTGLVKMQPEPAWLPGIDFLVVGLAAGTVLLGLTVVPWRRILGKAG